MSLLDFVHSPADVKKLSIEQLPILCNEVREFIIDNVSKYGGHFGASLGVVELTVALHYVYNTPHDQIIWDVGHQAYGHKILTGRKERFHTNRQYQGICGFPLREESVYDAFGVGHSSTSISAALGMSMASKLNNTPRSCVAVIGDGAMTAGLAFEAMNHAAVANTDLLVILNDNNMSIDPNVGGLNSYLTKISVSPTYNKFRDQVWDLLGKVPSLNQQIQQFASRIESSVKNAMLAGSNLFEALGLRYFGPSNGHDVITLVGLLNEIKNISGVHIFHVLTTKGKGFHLAEKDKTFWHAPGSFDKLSGAVEKKNTEQAHAPKYQDVFGKTIIELANANKKIVGITPAMPTGSSLKWMIEQMPDRAFDVGICEQHAVTLSAGMATQGMKVFCNIYSSFMQRAYDQVIHDVAIQKLPVIFCLDRGGLVGEDGATHHGIYDMAYMRCVPNMIVAAPMNEIELRNMMFTAQLDENTNPFSIRYPRGAGVTIDWQQPFSAIPVGKGRQIIKGKKIAILTIGHIGNVARAVIEKLQHKKINPSLYDMRFVKPLDERLIKKIASTYNTIITIEDGCLQGGFGSAVLEVLHHTVLNKKMPLVIQLGIPDKVIAHGEVHFLHKECGIDADTIQRKITYHWSKR